MRDLHLAGLAEGARGGGRGVCECGKSHRIHVRETARALLCINVGSAIYICASVVERSEIWNVEIPCACGGAFSAHAPVPGTVVEIAFGKYCLYVMPWKSSNGVRRILAHCRTLFSRYGLITHFLL